MKSLFVSLISLLSILPFNAWSQISNEVEAITDQIAQNGSLGFDKDIQYHIFLKLNEVATDAELVEITNHNSPAVRGYSFWVLAKRNYPDLKSIFLDHLDDLEEVYQKNGCMVGRESVISFMKQVVTPYMYDPDCMKLDDATRALVK